MIPQRNNHSVANGPCEYAQYLLNSSSLIPLRRFTQTVTRMSFSYDAAVGAAIFTFFLISLFPQFFPFGFDILLGVTKVIQSLNLCTMNSI
jgi:hypothetical protein